MSREASEKTVKIMKDGFTPQPKAIHALVLLDRDGVLCDNHPGGVINLSVFVLVPRLKESLEMLSGDHYRIGVFTNQHYLATGQASQRDYDEMSRRLEMVAEDAGIRQGHFVIKTCPHAEDANCTCRKPKTGLIEQIVTEFKLGPRETRFYAVGDKYSDLKTLKNYYDAVLAHLGRDQTAITTILITWEHGDLRPEFTGKRKADFVPDYEVDSLERAISFIKKIEEDRRFAEATKIDIKKATKGY